MRFREYNANDSKWRSNPGAIFPPRDEWDVAGYDNDEVVAGYRDYSPDIIAPGSNHSNGYRWGWLNRRRDTTGEPDGFDGVRWTFIRMSRRPQ
ncbi:MAG: hypothetical protein ACTHJQ_05465 [Rhizobiaceae bacterium]